MPLDTGADQVRARHCRDTAREVFVVTLDMAGD